MYGPKEAKLVGYGCGITYLTGGRIPLDATKQLLVASNLARGCCILYEAYTAFVEGFVQGYRDHVEPRVPEEQDYEVRLIRTMEYITRITEKTITEAYHSADLIDGGTMIEDFTIVQQDCDVFPVVKESNES